MDRCGPVTGLVLCAVPGNKWFQKKKKYWEITKMPKEWAYVAEDIGGDEVDEV